MILLHHMSDRQALFRKHMFSMGTMTILIDHHLRQFEQRLRPTWPSISSIMERDADPSSPGSSSHAIADNRSPVPSGRRSPPSHADCRPPIPGNREGTVPGTRHGSRI
ncbi:hypothetical protein CGRA01v4_13103 [Colletotrichum graminicola]|nr:hypothetical protein CGRA01v4_13103 [Colletotrichum graminicola]